MHRLLIIDDDVDMCRLLEKFFIRQNFEVQFCTSGKKGMEELEKNKPAVVICDFRLADTTGRELLIKIKQLYPDLPVIIITGYSDIKIAVDVIKHGAYDYVTKPLLPDELLLTIRNAIDAAEIPYCAPDLPTEVANQKPPHKHQKYIFGNSQQFNDILNQIDLVAPTNLSVIICGESGSGKEVIAQEIHARSKRNTAPFIAIDCGILSNDLAASELFGHEKGAFTGADVQKTGCMEMANGGTLFLDEISNLSADIQASLLRAVQERKVRRVGGIKDIDLDLRLIVASNEPLYDSTKRGTFRDDLYHRFNEFSIQVPPLRERVNDIPVFAHFFLEKSNEELEKNVKGFSPVVVNLFNAYSWPGNLRELRNTVKRATLLASGDYIDMTTLPFELVNHSKLDFDTELVASHDNVENEIYQQQVNSDNENTQPEPMRIDDDSMLVKPTLKSVSLDAEYEMILDALRRSNFNKSKAARLLNVDRKTLYNKIKSHDHQRGNYDLQGPSGA